MDLRKELTLKEIGTRTLLPLACHALPKKKKNVFTIIFRVSKFPNDTYQI